MNIIAIKYIIHVQWATHSSHTAIIKLCICYNIQFMTINRDQSDPPACYSILHFTPHYMLCNSTCLCNIMSYAILHVTPHHTTCYGTSYHT